MLLTAAAPAYAQRPDRPSPRPTVAAPLPPPCRFPSTPSSLPDQLSLERCQPLTMQTQLHRATPPEHKLAKIYALTMLGLFTVFQIARNGK